MGFYRPATIVTDAQRHGLKVFPIDVMESEWDCTVVGTARETVVGYQCLAGSREDKGDSTLDNFANGGASKLRVGLRYVRGLREDAARAIIGRRNLVPFTSIHDLVHRVPELRKDELNTLAEIGALNSINPSPRRPEGATFHRRDALWQIERSVRHSGPLLDELSEPDFKSPLHPMNPEERLVADFRGTGLTVGPHPMAYHRARMDAIGVRKASDLAGIPNGKYLRIGGCVIARQRPGTAKGFVFLSLEDETGVANAIVMPDLFQKNRLLVTTEQFLMVEGILQNQDNVISVKARRLMPLSITQAETSSHDFY